MSEIQLSADVIGKLEQFVSDVEHILLNKENVHYFEIDPQQRHEDQLTSFNGRQIKQILPKPCVYAIWVKTATDTTFHYIGHSAGPTARSRLINHFFKKHPRTGSQLDRVKQAVTDGYTVGFTYVAVDPPLVRLYVESKLIARYGDLCDWNIHSKGEKRKSTMSSLV